METLDVDTLPENIVSREIKFLQLSQLSLYIFPAQEKTLSPFLRALRAPILRELNLDFAGNAKYNFYRCAFRASHSHQLRKFSLSNFYVHDRALLQTMPNRRTLVLSQRNIILSAKTFDTMRTEAQLSRLTRLSVAVGFPERGVDPMDSVRAAVALVESRFTSPHSAAVARLAHVDLDDWTDRSPVGKELASERLDSVLERLRDLKQSELERLGHLKKKR